MYVVTHTSLIGFFFKYAPFCRLPRLVFFHIFSLFPGLYCPQKFYANLQDTQERQLLHLVRGKPLKPLYIRQPAEFLTYLFYSRLKIQYIFYIYDWFSQLHFCQYPALPEKSNWLSETLFLFLVEKTVTFFIYGWFFQITFLN